MRAAIKIDIKGFDSLDAAATEEFVGRPVMDTQGRAAGTLECSWIDPSTRRAEFVGVKTGPGRIDVIPSRAMDLNGDRLEIRAVLEFVRNGPAFQPEAELAELEKQQVNQYYGYFVPIRRASSIEDLRPEEKAKASGQSTDADREETEHQQQAFFKQKRLCDRFNG